MPVASFASCMTTANASRNISQCPWLRTTGLDYLENRCWGHVCPHYGRGGIPVPPVLLVHSAEMKMPGLQSKRPLWKLRPPLPQSHLRRSPTLKSLDPFTVESRLCRGFLNSTWSTMFNQLVVSKHGCCQNHPVPSLGLEDSHLVEIGWSLQASMFCNHQLVMSEILNPLWTVVCIGEALK